MQGEVGQAGSPLISNDNVTTAPPGNPHSTLLDFDDGEPLKNNKFTMTGFVRTLMVFVNKNNFETIWQVLRSHDYTDELTLSVPDNVLSRSASVRLQDGAVSFLTSLFHLNKEPDGLLGPAGSQRIFQVLPNESPFPPWHPYRERIFFQSSPYKPDRAVVENSVERSDDIGYLSALEASTGNLIVPPGPVGGSVYNVSLSSSYMAGSTSLLLPPGSMMMDSADIGSSVFSFIPRKLTLRDFLSHWHLCAASNPGGTALELFRLGYVPYCSINSSISTSISNTTVSGNRPLLILVTGSNRDSNESFVQALKEEATRKTKEYTSNVDEAAPQVDSGKAGCSVCFFNFDTGVLPPDWDPSSSPPSTPSAISFVQTVVVTVASQFSRKPEHSLYDLCIIVFDANDKESERYSIDTSEEMGSGVKRFFYMSGEG